MAVLILVIKGGPTLPNEPYASCVIALPRGNSDDIAESAERANVLLRDLGFGPFHHLYCGPAAFFAASFPGLLLSRTATEGSGSPCPTGSPPKWTSAGTVLDLHRTTAKLGIQRFVHIAQK